MVSIKKIYSDRSGDLLIVVDENGSPFPYAYLNNYYLTNMKKRGLSKQTSIKMLYTLGMIYDWASAVEIKLDQELSTGDFLSDEQANELALYLNLNSQSQKIYNEISRQKNIKPHCKLKRLLDKKLTTVSKFETSTRIRWVIKYLNWHVKHRNGSVAKNKSDVERIKLVSDIVISTLSSLVPPVSTIYYDESLEGLSSDVCQVAELMFNPDSRLNPFKSMFNKIRNYLIFHIYLETGMRREELVFLRVENFDFSRNKLKISKSKTFNRQVSISVELSNLLHEFIIKYYSKLPLKNRKHGYMFTTTHGVQIKPSTINLIFNTVVSNNSNLPKSFTPHALRRTFADNYYELFYSQSNTNSTSYNDSLNTTLNRLMGWVPSSRMPARYGKGAIRRRADNLAERLAEEINEKYKKDIK